jgi:hypothetical protein
MRTTLVAMALWLLSGCAAPFRESRAVCPEYRSLRCATPPDCAMDERRGCLVCQCQGAGIDPTMQPPPPGAPPYGR